MFFFKWERGKKEDEDVYIKRERSKGLITTGLKQQRIKLNDIEGFVSWGGCGSEKIIGA